MSDRFFIGEANICTFIFENGNIKPNLDEYPNTRLCVIDRKNDVAIDILDELKYDYIQTVNGLYFVGDCLEKITENKMTLVIRNDGSGLFLFPELLLTGVPTGHGVPKYLPVFRTASPPVFRKSAEKNAEKASFWP